MLAGGDRAAIAPSKKMALKFFDMRKENDSGQRAICF